MHQDEELHALLLKQFREYFEANQDWLNKGTKRSGIRLRQIMSDIRRKLSARRVAVREWGIEKEAELEYRAKHRGQKSGTVGDADTN